MNDVNSYEEGRVLLIDKPLRWTSFDVIRRIRSTLKVKKVGHAGTLDPLATGLLIVCTGRFTKKINQFMALEKEYTGTFTLGAVTATFDLESEPAGFRPIDGVSEEMLNDAVKKFTGDISQLPPVHSAIKQRGKPVYLLARKGVDVVMEPRRITIHDFQIDASRRPIISFKVVCTTGTYIRSLANDFGQALGCGAYLSSLCRTRIGGFTLQNAISIEDFTALERTRN
jgi:tRNA pseudouridine55 synthase